MSIVLEAPYSIVLGVAQDGGRPQAGCRRPCCESARADPTRRRHSACLAVVDPATDRRWIIEATPDFREQLAALDLLAPVDGGAGLDGIVLTHGHMGHYTGLMFVGDEAMGARRLPVYALPRMAQFLSSNGPWDRLVHREHIALHRIAADVPFALDERIRVTPLLVPHRDEYTEAAGFRVDGPDRSVLFIPDIDKWERWDRHIEDLVADVDVAYLDGTFYAPGELPGRDMSRIPHPFITESMERFAMLPAGDRAKVRFIHLNHTNPALDEESEEARAIRAAGFGVAREGERERL